MYSRLIIGLLFWGNSFGLFSQSVLDTVCTNQAPSHLAVPYHPKYRYVWHVGNGNIIGKADSSAIEVDWQNALPGILPVWVVAIDKNTGCPGDTSRSSLLITEKNRKLNTQNREFCQGEIITLESPLKQAFYWQNGSRKAWVSFRAQRDTIVRLIALGGECGNDTLNFEVKVNYRPQASISALPDTLPKMTEKTLRYEGMLKGGENIEWFLNGYSKGKGKVVSITFEESGWNELAQLIWANACADTLWRDIYIDDAFALHFPNSFTPNNDGLNDRWNFSGVGYSSYTAQVYDRWGALLYSWTDENNLGWEGTIKGQPAMQGAYVYIVTVIDYRGKQRVYKDYFNLLR